MRIRTNILSWIGILLAIIGMGAVLVSNINKWLVLIPVAILVAALVSLLKDVTLVGTKPIRWALIAAWSLVIFFTIATILGAVFFGWLALLPFILLCGAVIWLVWLVKKTLVWVPTIALIIAIILFGVYCIMGSFMKDWNAAMDTLTVKTLIVENADIENADVENETVTNQNVENQEVTNQKVENSVVTNQKVESQTVTNQKVENQEVTNQKVENSVVTNQKVENQEVTNQKVENQTVTNQTVNQQNKEEEPKKEEGNKEEPHKHVYTSKAVAPTCTDKGYTIYTCKCGDTYKDAYKGALGHKYTTKVVAPTKTEKGYTLHTCERCGHSYKDNYTECKNEDVHKHAYATKVVAPTCTEKGYTIYTCKCGDTYKDAYKNALGHKYATKVVAPTCTEKGYTLYTCERCGHSYKDNYTAKLEPEVTPTIKCAKTIRYGETLFVNLEGIKASNLLVSNKNFVAIEIVSDSRVAIELIEDVDGYITITDSVSRVNVVIDIVSDETTTSNAANVDTVSKATSSTVKSSKPSFSSTEVTTSNTANVSTTSKAASSTAKTSKSTFSTTSTVNNQSTSSNESSKNESSNASSNTTTSQATNVEEVTPEIKCASTIRYGETLFVNLKGINVSDLYVGNPAFVAVESISDSRVSVTLTEDVTGYIVLKDNVSGYSITVEIVE